ncbi:MAG: nuclear transport factor 2 family protein [Acidobacteriia bacterium]|nr:nuclear transport factor 2 family protein [Terriglobia bacterium]
MPSNIEVVEAYLNGLRKRDMSDAPLLNNVVFENPLGGTLQGKHNVIRFINAYLPMMNEVRVLRHIAEGDHVATLWEAITPFGTLTLFQMFTIENESIKELRSFYDPREFLESMGTHGGN